MRRLIFVFVLAPLACANLDAPPSEPPREPGPPLPEGVVLDPGARFSANVIDAELAYPVQGAGATTVVARLTSPEGRRALVLRGAGGDAPVLPEAWYATVVAASAASGELCVCASRLTGRPTALTEGATPDPRLGVDVVCATGRDGAFEAPVALAPPKGAYFVAGVVPQPEGGFALRVLLDQSGLVAGPPLPGDGWFKVPLREGVLGTPVLVELLDPVKP